MNKEDFFNEDDFTPRPFTDEHRNMIKINCEKYVLTFNSKNGEYSHLDSSIRRSRFKEYIKSQMKVKIDSTEDYSDIIDNVTSYFSKLIVDFED